MSVSSALRTAGATAQAAMRVGVWVAHVMPTTAATMSDGTRKRNVSRRRRFDA